MGVVKVMLLVTIATFCCCVYYTEPVIETTNHDPERAIAVLSDSGYTDIEIVGECWNDYCKQCFSTGFVAIKNGNLVAGCMYERTVEYGVNPKIVLINK